LKPSLAQLKQQLMQMSRSDLAKFDDKSELEALYYQQPEVKALKEEIKQLVADVKAQTIENL
jgi:hypothetical protein